MNDYAFFFQFICGCVIIVVLAVLLVFIICVGTVVIKQAIERLEDFYFFRKKKQKYKGGEK